MVSERVQYQGKAGWFFKLNFQFNNSQNTGKCELGWFLLRQLQLLPTQNEYIRTVKINS